MTDPRFPPPWTVEKILGEGLVVRDANGQSLAYVMSRANPSDAHIAKMLTDDETQWLASNIAKLPDLLWTAEAMPIAALWASSDPAAWERALASYWKYVKAQNLDLERSLDSLDLERLRGMDSEGWYRLEIHGSQPIRFDYPTAQTLR